MNSHRLNGLYDKTRSHGSVEGAKKARIVYKDGREKRDFGRKNNQNILYAL